MSCCVLSFRLTVSVRKSTLNKPFVFTIRKLPGVQNYRLIGTGAQILKRLGVGQMRLMSTPIRFNALSGFNLEVTDFVQS